MGGMRATEVSSDYLNSYVIARQQAHAMNGSINRELSLLRRAFSLGMTATPAKVLRCPNFPRLKESPPRKGFLDDSDSITRACPELWFRSLIEVARTYGWRSAELKSMKVDQVDLAARTIRLNPGSTKNSDGRVAYMTDAVFTLLSACVAGKRGEEAVFTRPNGKPVLDFRGIWRSACVQAGVGKWVCKRCAGDQVLDAGKCSNCGATWKRKDWRYRGAFSMTGAGPVCGRWCAAGFPRRWR
jgi:integrase